jgi:hypothetical protein
MPSTLTFSRSISKIPRSLHQLHHPHSHILIPTVFHDKGFFFPKSSTHFIAASLDRLRLPYLLGHNLLFPTFFGPGVFIFVPKPFIPGYNTKVQNA